VRQIPRFAATRCVIAPDLPGLGDSDPPEDPGDPPTVARSVVAGLRRLLDGQRADLAGFSYGAIVAGLVAAEMSDGLRALLTAGAGAVGVPRHPVVLTKIRDKEGAARIAAHRANLASMMIADPAGIDDLAVEIQELNTVLGRFRSRSFANSTLLKDALARTTLPVCAVWGERDQIAADRVGDRIAAVRQARPDALTGRIPGAGHWVMYEAPDAFDAAMEGFLAGAARQGG
jgi:pimeloyl-ACP methyl ester carboxylesterase